MHCNHRAGYACQVRCGYLCVSPLFRANYGLRKLTFLQFYFFEIIKSVSTDYIFPFIVANVFA